MWLGRGSDVSLRRVFRCGSKSLSEVKGKRFPAERTPGDPLHWSSFKQPAWKFPSCVERKAQEWIEYHYTK